MHSISHYNVIVKNDVTSKYDFKEPFMAMSIFTNKSDLNQNKIHHEELPALGDGEIRLRIESFSVTANNVTYAVIGDRFGYWNFFPATEGFGIVPMWGHAVVEQSKHPDIAKGERVYGYLPMATHLDVMPGKINANGFLDTAAHRQPMSAIYNQYSRLSSDPEHDADHENERMIFAPLFKTGFLIEDFFRRNSWFGASSLLMTSASSKTAMGLASCAKNLSPHIKRIGVTSPNNLAFTRDTGLYDDVYAYDDIASIPKSESVAVDFAGSAAVLRSIHEHLGGNLKYSCLVGATHVGDRSGGAGAMPGPEPILFFAPTHAVAALKEMGAKAFGEAVAKQWTGFLSAVKGSITIDEREGIANASDAFLSILNNKADPSVGIVIKP
jgi:hypothetical protein